MSFPGGYPAKEAADRLQDELQFQRACQVYLWALPAMNITSMRLATKKAFGDAYNIVPVWKDRPNANTIITTANPDVIYSMN
jgi:hypothetical protein